jgi:hypothetical protein
MRSPARSDLPPVVSRLAHIVHYHGHTMRSLAAALRVSVRGLQMWASGCESRKLTADAVATWLGCDPVDVEACRGLSPRLRAVLQDARPEATKAGAVSHLTFPGYIERHAMAAALGAELGWDLHHIPPPGAVGHPAHVWAKTHDAAWRHIHGATAPTCKE